MTSSRAQNQSCFSTSSKSRRWPYLRKIEQLGKSYPALWPLVDKLDNHDDYGRQHVAMRFSKCDTYYAGSPSRCAVLTFNKTSVDCRIYRSSEELGRYLVLGASNDQGTPQCRRLFILEDLEPSFVDLLGEALSIDPLVFSEQMNTWSSTDSRSVPYRAVPSMQNPETSFTLRYFEIRTLDNGKSIHQDKNQMTFAVNRRRIDRWRDIDLPSVYPDRRHGLVRRCASFWTNHQMKLHSLPEKGQHNDTSKGWDAVILVDPPMDSCPACALHNSLTHEGKKSADQMVDNEPDHACDSSCSRPTEGCNPSCLILEDPKKYETRNELWHAENWTKPERVQPTRHNSMPYHGGGPSLLSPPMRNEKMQHALCKPRNLNSPFDEMIFYWTECLDQTLLEKVHQNAVNSAHYLLKFVAQHWAHQLELIGYHVYNSEWFADEHDANVHSLSPNWKKELEQIAYVTKDINYTLRQMSRFDHAINLNLERLGSPPGSESVGGQFPKALLDAQRDFLAISARLKPLRQRIDDISGIANDVANLKASLKGIQDGENGLRVSLFAAIIFPLTLVAATFSMSDGYRPGQENFWVFFAASVPLALLIGTLLLFGELQRHFQIFKKAHAIKKKSKPARQRSEVTTMESV